MKNKFLKRVLLILLLVSCVLGALYLFNNETNKIKNPDKKSISETIIETQQESKEEIPIVKEVRIKALGDILYHGPLNQYGKYKGKDGSYDFTDHYALIKDFLQDADLTIANLESPINPNRPVSSYPNFNPPADLLKYLKDTGIDILATANNHALDTGVEGVYTTIEEIEKVGIEHFGTQKDIKDKYLITKINDISIGVLGYTDSLNGYEVLLDTPEKKNLINKLDPETIKKDIEHLKNENVDIILIYPHWGNEYVQKNSEEYIQLARKMIDWGADAVLGNHPHVVLQSETHKSPDGREGFIIHAMGNFISNQTLETLNNIRTEHGAIVELKFSKNFKDSKVSLEEHKVYPTWMKRTALENNLYLHQVVLAEEYQDHERGKKAYQMTMEKINEKLD